VSLPTAAVGKCPDWCRLFSAINVVLRDKIKGTPVFDGIQKRVTLPYIFSFLFQLICTTSNTYCQHPTTSRRGRLRRVSIRRRREKLQKSSLRNEPLSKDRILWHYRPKCQFRANGIRWISSYVQGEHARWEHLPVNPLKHELNSICYLLALLGAHHFLHVSRIRVKLLTFRLLMSYIYGAPILDVSRSHTTTQHSR